MGIAQRGRALGLDAKSEAFVEPLGVGIGDRHVEFSGAMTARSPVLEEVPNQPSTNATTPHRLDHADVADVLHAFSGRADHSLGAEPSHNRGRSA